MTAQIDMELFVGAAFEAGFRFVSLDGGAEAAIDMSGWGLRWAAWDGAGDAVLNASTEDGGLAYLAAGEGRFAIALSAAATAAIAPGRYEHALVPIVAGEVKPPLWRGGLNARALAGALTGP